MEEPPSDLEDMEMVLGQQLARKWEPSSKGHESMNSVNNEREFESGSFPNQKSQQDHPSRTRSHHMNSPHLPTSLPSTCPLHKQLLSVKCELDTENT